MATDHHGIPIPAGDEPVPRRKAVCSCPHNVFDAAATGWATAAATLDRTLGRPDLAPTCARAASSWLRCGVDPPQPYQRQADGLDRHRVGVLLGRVGDLETGSSALAAPPAPAGGVEPR